MADLNSIKANILTYLTVGISDVECNTCCPECGNIYVFAGADTFTTWADTVGATVNPGDEPIISKTPCCYEKCITELYDYVGSADNIESILETGIAEYSTIQGQSFVCLLLDFADENNLSGNDLTELILFILNAGIVVSCIDGKTVVGSVNTWNTWAEASLESPIVTCKTACCLTITGNLDITLKIEEELGWLPFNP
jgi:hypothetical protein